MQQTMCDNWSYKISMKAFMKICVKALNMINYPSCERVTVATVPAVDIRAKEIHIIYVAPPSL